MLQHVGVDADGNTYVAGYFNGDLHINGETLKSIEQRQLLVLKADPWGRVRWFKTAPASQPTDTIRLNDLHVTSAGELYLIGGYQGSIQFGQTTHTNNGAEDAFLARLSADGQWQWSRVWGQGLVDTGWRVHAGPRQQLYAVIATRGNQYIGTQKTIHVGATTKPNFSLLQLTQAGALRWHYQLKSDGITAPGGLGVDSQGNAYVSFTSTAALQLETIQLKGVGGEAAFLARFDASGAPHPCPRKGHTLCGTVCTTLQADPRHCGACQKACSSGQTCTQGSCQ